MTLTENKQHLLNHLDKIDADIYRLGEQRKQIITSIQVMERLEFEENQRAEAEKQKEES